MPDYSSRDERIPRILREQARWLTWSTYKDPHTGRPRKKPAINVNDASRVVPFAKVENTACQPTSGLGFLMTGTVPVDDYSLVPLDLDGCRRPDGETSEWAQKIIDHYDSYTEVTPSQTGFRVWLAVKELPDDDVKRSVQVPFPSTVTGKTAGFEIFDGKSPRFVTVTGQRCHGDGIRKIDNLDWVVDSLMMRKGALPGEHDEKEFHPRADDLDRARFGLLELGLLDHMVDDYPLWLEKVGMALAAFGDDGLALWDTWSKRSEKYAPGACEEKWPGFEGRRTPASLFKMFDDQDKGWRNAYVHARAANVFGSLNGAAPQLNGAAPPADAPFNAMVGTSPEDVLKRWGNEGELVHAPTGIAAIDEQTGGGPTIPCRVYINGGPDAGKTALVTQFVDHYAQQGIPCGMLAIDEEDGDLMQRFMQRRGWMREQCEQRDPELISKMTEQVGALPVRFFGPEHTIESAAVALHWFAGKQPAVLVIDSLQTARCEAEAGSSRYEDVTARVAAIRAVAERYRMLVFTTSEMSRAAYRDSDPSKRIDDMASGKESGAIEYSARVLLAVRSVPGYTDLTEARIVKNKLGPRTRDDRPGIYLKLDRARQTLAEETEFQLPDGANGQTKLERATSDARWTVEWLLANEGAVATEAKAALSLAVDANVDGRRWQMVEQVLGKALVKTRAGTSKQLRIDLSELDPELWPT